MLEHTTRLGTHCCSGRAPSNSRGCRASWAVLLQKSEMSATTHTAHVCWNIQLASELVVVQPELGQIDKIPELLGQLSCNTRMNFSKDTTHVCWGIQVSPSRPHLTMRSSLRLVRAPHADGIPPVNLLKLSGASPRSRTVKFARSPSALHSSPTAIHKTKSGHRKSFLIIIKSNETKSGMAL